MEKIKVGGFTLLYEMNDNGAVITGIEGMDSYLDIPGYIFKGENSEPTIVAAVGKKALLGVNGLRHIVIPETVTEIGDWAFSHCRHLVSLIVLNRKVTLGRGILEGCDRINIICRGYEEHDDLSYLMATVVNKLPAGYLLGSAEAGTETWFRNYDSSLLQYLNDSDYAGSDASALCGEEDISYDDIRSVDGELLGADMSYIIGVRKNKCNLCMLRLMHSEHLADETRTFLEKYISERTIAHTNNSAWLTLRDDLYDDASYLTLYLDITSPTQDDIELMLNNLGNEHPEMKAQLLKHSSGGNLVDSFFDNLLL